MLGPYRVQRILGKGGMGQVFLAEDTRLKRTVALKTMHKKYASSSMSRRRFVHEARAMAAIKHDHVVTVYEVGEYKGQPFLAMELLKGQSLDQRLQSEQRLPYRQAFEYGLQIANGLSAAHAQGIIHRDIKPANIWIEEPLGRVKILDFGLAMAGGVNDSLFSRDAVVGTPAYLAPEQCQGETVDERCDLYSLGVVLYQLCCGKAPLVAASIYEQLIKIISAPPLRPELICPELPVQLGDIIMKLLSKEPHDRFANASMLEASIRGALAAVDDQHHAAMRIVTQPEPVAAGTVTQASSSAGKSSKQAKKTQQQKWVLIGTAISATLLLSIGMWWKFGTKKVAGAPMKITQPTAEPVVTTAALAPLKLPDLIAHTNTLVKGEQATFRINLQNTATDPRQDPKLKYAKVRSVAQISTTMLRDGQSPVKQLVYPRRLSGAQLPLSGQVSPIDITFNTQSLDPGKYVVQFKLEALNGQLLSELSTELEVQENLGMVDLLGFELLSANLGKGADTTVTSGTDTPAGAEKELMLQLHSSSGQLNQRHIYCRFDVTQAKTPVDDMGRVILMLTMAKGSSQAPTVLKAYAVPDTAQNWQELPPDALIWKTCPSAQGVESLKFLGQTRVENLQGSWEERLHKVRIYSDALDQYVRTAGDQVTILIVQSTDQDKELKFVSREGSTDQGPALAIRAKSR